MQLAYADAKLGRLYHTRNVPTSGYDFELVRTTRNGQVQNCAVGTTATALALLLTTIALEKHLIVGTVPPIVSPTAMKMQTPTFLVVEKNDCAILQTKTDSLDGLSRSNHYKKNSCCCTYE